MKKRVKKKIKLVGIIIFAFFIYSMWTKSSSLWKSYYSYKDKFKSTNEAQSAMKSDNAVETTSLIINENEDDLEEKSIEVLKIKKQNSKGEEKIIETPKVKEKVNKEEKAVFSNNNVKTNKYVFPTLAPKRAKPSKDKYLVIVKLSEQKVHVYKNENKIKTMACSTGRPGKNSETPIGKYKINDSFGQSFYSSKYKQGARYWVGFIGSQYLFHSVPTGQNGQVITQEADKIGSKASHGCVRLAIDDSFWFYETVPKGAEVIIET